MDGIKEKNQTAFGVCVCVYLPIISSYVAAGKQEKRTDLCDGREEPSALTLFSRTRQSLGNFLDETGESRMIV